MRGVLWLLVLEAILAGCVVQTDLARSESADCGADGGDCAREGGVADTGAEVATGMDGMNGGMGGAMQCDAHDCDGAVLDTGSESPDEMQMP